MKRFIGAALSLGLLLAPCAHAEDLPLAGGAGTRLFPLRTPEANKAHPTQ